MKQILVSSLIIFVIFTQNIDAQVVIGQPPVQQNQQQNQQMRQVNNNQQQNNQQTTQLSDSAIQMQIFQEYVRTFFPEAEPSWVANHTTAETITSPVTGYKIIRNVNGQPSVSDYLIPKGAIVAKYKDESTDEYYRTISEGCYIVRVDRYNAVVKAVQKKAEEQKKLAEKTEKQNKKNAKKLAKQNRSPEEKAMDAQVKVAVVQQGVGFLERLFYTIKAAKVYNGSGYTNASYSSGGVQMINW